MTNEELTQEDMPMATPFPTMTGMRLRILSQALTLTSYVTRDEIVVFSLDGNEIRFVTLPDGLVIDLAMSYDEIKVSLEEQRSARRKWKK